jgi:L-lactate dehydrogenase complex protein LldG
MSGRDQIFAKIRKALDVKADDASRKDVADRRIAARHRHPTPERVAGKSPAQLTKLFRGFLETCSATVLEIPRAEIPAAISRYLRENNLPQRVRSGSDSRLDTMAWDQVPALERLAGRADAKDEVGLSHATAGVAETGTLVMASGADNPVTLNFVPETHIVVVDAADIVGPYEDALDKVRARFGDRTMPRTVNMISGPSRTGDIGGRIVLGAHGPRRMCVIIATG